MNKEHTIVNGANRLDECVKHIEKAMGEDGYRVNVMTIAGGSVTQVHVAKVGMIGKVVAYAALNLWKVGDDLKFKCERNSAVNGLNLGMPNPLDLMMGIPFGMTKMLLDAHKQTKLEERLHMVTLAFLTGS